MEGSKFPKEWNRQNFFQGNRAILQGVGVSAGDEGDSKYTSFPPKVACEIQQLAPDGEARAMPCGGDCNLGTPTILRSPVRTGDEDSPTPRGPAPAPLAPRAACPLPGKPSKPSPPGSPEPQSLRGPRRRAGEGGISKSYPDPERYLPEQTGQGMARGAKTAAAASRAAAAAATASRAAAAAAPEA